NISHRPTASPDLYLLTRRKFLIFAGWNDPFVPPGISVDYYTSAGGQDWREGGTQFRPPFHGPWDALLPWHRRRGHLRLRSLLRCRANEAVRQGAGVDRRGRTLSERDASRRRLMCAYPKIAVYKGIGNADDLTNFHLPRSMNPSGSGISSRHVLTHSVAPS